MALPLWAAFNRATPPIWVDVPMAVDHIALKKEKHKGGSDQSQVLSDGATWMEWNGLNSWFRGDPSRIGGGGDVRISKPLAAAMSRDACLNTVYSTLRRPEMRYSTHKAANAKTLLFW
ncbi:unnamed protein product [Symbiodinium microadriaticum]|nr:unnamed protein product [Symbiodinium microadriaticum]